MAKKNSTKSTKKTTKIDVDFTVDMTNVEDLNEAYAAFADAKAKKYMMPCEYDALINDIVDKYGFVITVCGGDCPYCKKSEKKPNIFKRFWNWITRKK